MPDRCEVLPGDAVVARRGGALLWVDAPGSPALVAALHACLGVSRPRRRPGAVRRRRPGGLARPRGARPSPSCSPTPGGPDRVALWGGKGQPAVDGVPVSGSSVEGGTLASGFRSGQSLYVGPGGPRPRCRRVSPSTSSRAPCRVRRVLQTSAAGAGRLGRGRRPRPAAAPPAPSSYGAARTSAFGPPARQRRPAELRRADRVLAARAAAGADPAVRRRHGRHRRRGPRARPPSRQPRAGDRRLGPRRARSPTPRTCSPPRTRRCSATAARCRWSTSARSTARTSPGPRPPSGPSSSPASPTRSPTATASSSAGPSSPSSSPLSRPASRP